MNNILKKQGHELLKTLALSFFFVSITLSIFLIIFEEKINLAVSLVNKITIAEQKKPFTDSQMDIVKKRLKNYPSFGEKYANLLIPSINLDLPIYHGDTLDILRYGVGHYAGSYFPGEDASVILAAHNNAGFFRKLPEIKIGENIIIKTTYGTFEYEVYETKIIKETNTDAFLVQKEQELLMLYTCYPVTTIGHTDQRYVVYAKKVREYYES